MSGYAEQELGHLFIGESANQLYLLMPPLRTKVAVLEGSPESYGHVCNPKGPVPICEFLLSLLASKAAEQVGCLQALDRRTTIGSDDISKGEKPTRVRKNSQLNRVSCRHELQTRREAKSRVHNQGGASSMML